MSAVKRFVLGSLLQVGGLIVTSIEQFNAETFHATTVRQRHEARERRRLTPPKREQVVEEKPKRARAEKTTPAPLLGVERAQLEVAREKVREERAKYTRALSAQYTELVRRGAAFTDQFGAGGWKIVDLEPQYTQKIYGGCGPDYVISDETGSFFIGVTRNCTGFHWWWATPEQPKTSQGFCTWSFKDDQGDVNPSPEKVLGWWRERVTKESRSTVPGRHRWPPTTRFREKARSGRLKKAV